MRDIFCMGIILGKDQGLWYPLTVGEQDRQRFLERADDGPDLVRCNHAPVQLISRIQEIIIQLLPPLATGVLVPLVHIVPALNDTPVLGDVGFDPEYIVPDIHPVRNGPFVEVFHHQVLIEEPECLLGGGGRQANQEPIEILQHLPPEMVDRAVALISHDEIKGLDRDTGIVGNLFWL